MALSTAACRHRPRIDRQRSPRFAGFSSPVRLPRSMRAVLSRALLMVSDRPACKLVREQCTDAPSQRLHPSLQERRWPGAVSCTDLLPDDVRDYLAAHGMILAWKATPPRSWSNSSLRLRRVVPGAHWRGRPRTGSRHARDCGKIGRGPWRRDGF